ncbi:MAG: hypothetical protein WAK17_15390 [Candidatus Nitrosopolaris sp.]
MHTSASMIKGTMNTTTNLFVLLIVISFILPATAIRYAKAATENLQESNSTGNEQESSSSAGNEQQESSSSTENSQQSNNTGNEQQESNNAGNATSTAVRENATSTAVRENATSSSGFTQNNATSSSGFTQNERFRMQQAYKAGYDAGSGGAVDTCSDWYGAIVETKDMIPYCHQGFVAGQHDKETGKTN